LPIGATNIPIEYMRFTESSPIYWEVEMISFTKGEQKLKVKVVDYHTKKVGNFREQKPKYEILKLEFLPLHWNELQSFLTTYQKKFLQSVITEEPFKKVNLAYIHVPLKVKLSNLNFELGFASFTKSFKWNDGLDEFRIPLADSIPEFNHIKPYFKKVIGKSTIDVLIEVESSAERTKVAAIKSIDLEKINEESIRILKVRKLDQWSSKKPKFAPPDKDVFTFEEAMESYGDEAFGNIDILEKDLLFHLLGKEDVRNRFQLQYLVEKIHDEKEKLLMTLVPQFGFVFINYGEEMTHLIWELLNSHATYIWSTPSRSTANIVKRIENEIRSINVHGRTHYKSNFQNTEDLFFHTLIHRSSSYSYEQYFSRWKKNVNNILI
jgi:hypothetical protein